MRSGRTFEMLSMVSPSRPRRRPTSCDCRADEAGDGEQLDIVDAGERLGGDVALRVTDDGGRLDAPGVDALTAQRADPGELGQEDAGQRDARRAEHVGVGQLGSVVVLGRLPHRDDVDPRQRRERDTRTGQLARDRSEPCLGLADQRLEVGLERVVTYEIGQRLQPSGTLTAEAHCVRGSVDDAVDESAAAL